MTGRQSPARHGTVVLAVRVGQRTHDRLVRIAGSYGTTPGQLARFILAGVRERDVKRLLMASISQIADDDRGALEADDTPEDAETDDD